MSLYDSLPGIKKPVTTTIKKPSIGFPSPTTRQPSVVTPVTPTPSPQPLITPSQPFKLPSIGQARPPAFGQITPQPFEVPSIGRLAIPRTKFTQALPERVAAPSIGRRFGQLGQLALGVVEELERPFQAVIGGIKAGVEAQEKREDERLQAVLDRPEFSATRQRLGIEGLDIESAKTKIRSQLPPSQEYDMNTLLKASEKKLLSDLPAKSLLTKEALAGAKRGFAAPVGVAKTFEAIRKGEEVPISTERIDFIKELEEKIKISPTATRLFPEGSQAREIVKNLGSLGLQIIGDPVTYLGAAGLVNKADDVFRTSKAVKKLLKEAQTGRAAVKGINTIPDVKRVLKTLDDVIPEEAIKAKAELPDFDTLASVATELPKKKIPVPDALESAYQVIVSKNVPFEKIGGKAKIQASNINRVTGTVEHNLVKAQVDTLGNEVGRSVAELVDSIPIGKKKEFYDYLLHNHNVSRFKQGSGIFGDEVTDVMSAAKARQYETANPTFKALKDGWVKYNDNLMDWNVKTGMVSKETADNLKKIYPQYATSTYRMVDLPLSNTDFGQNIKKALHKATGSEKVVAPLDIQMIAATERTIRNGRKNELMNTLYDTFKEAPESIARYVKGVSDDVVEKTDDFLDVGKRLDLEPFKEGKDFKVNFYKDGKPLTMTISSIMNEGLKTAASDDIINKVGDIVKKYATQPFKNVITTYNPLFTGSNIMRDIPTAMSYSDNPALLVKNVPKAIQEMITNGADFRRFSALGGSREGLIKAGKGVALPKVGKKTTLDTIRKSVKAPLTAVEKVNSATETLPRFAEYLAVLEATGDPALAIYKSAELTTDFSRFGKLTKTLDKFIPYLNPSVQGIDKFARSMLKNPLKTAAKAALFITVPTAILDYINKDNENYQQLSPRERNLYYQIPIPGSDKFLRVPKSRELGVAFSSIYEWVARKSRGEDVTSEEIMQTLKENFNPANAPIWTPASKAWRQIKDPDAYETNYFGGLIVPQALRKYSPEQQYDPNSTSIARDLGKALKVSPKVIDYLIKSYTGIIGQVVQPLAAIKGATILEPIERKFITDPVFKSNVINVFYEEFNKAGKKAEDYEKREGVKSGALEVLAKNLGRASKLLSNIRKSQKRIEADTTLSVKEKESRIKELQIQMIDIAKKSLKAQLDINFGK